MTGDTQVEERQDAIDFDAMPTLGDIPRYHAARQPARVAIETAGASFGCGHQMSQSVAYIRTSVVGPPS